MKMSLTLLGVLVMVFAATIADATDADSAPIAADDVIDAIVVADTINNDANTDAADNNSGGGSRYCCYEIKRHLESRITNAENRAEALIHELRLNVKINLDKLKNMEKKIDDREDEDYERLQTEVLALTAMVGDLEDGLKHLRGVDKQQHEHLVKELHRLEERLDEDAEKIEDTLKDHEGEFETLFQKDEQFEKFKHHASHKLEEAEVDRQQLWNETTRIDGKLSHVGEMTMKAFEDLESRLANATAKLDAFADKENVDEVDVAALTQRVNATEGGLQDLTGRVDVGERELDRLYEDLHVAFNNVSDRFLEQGGAINDLQDGEAALKRSVDVFMMDLANNYDNIEANQHNITQLHAALEHQAAQVAVNANTTAELGSQLKQLGDGLEALKQNLEDHRQHVVEQLKKLTDIIMAK